MVDRAGVGRGVPPKDRPFGLSPQQPSPSNAGSDDGPTTGDRPAAPLNSLPQPRLRLWLRRVFPFVLTVGIVLSLFNAGVGIGVSVRIPFTSSNVTVAGSVGSKVWAAISEALPNYTEGRLGGNQNFFNNSTTMTIGPAEGRLWSSSVSKMARLHSTCTSRSAEPGRRHMGGERLEGYDCTRGLRRRLEDKVARAII